MVQITLLLSSGTLILPRINLSFLLTFIALFSYWYCSTLFGLQFISLALQSSCTFLFCLNQVRVRLSCFQLRILIHVIIFLKHRAIWLRIISKLVFSVVVFFFIKCSFETHLIEILKFDFKNWLFCFCLFDSRLDFAGYSGNWTAQCT